VYFPAQRISEGVNRFDKAGLPYLSSDELLGVAESQCNLSVDPRSKDLEKKAGRNLVIVKL
jgi:hypothetical protein